MGRLAALGCLLGLMGCVDHQNADEIPTKEEYLAQVYPGETEDRSRDITFSEKFFFYEDAPISFLHDAGEQRSRQTDFAGWTPFPGSFMHFDFTSNGLPKGYPFYGVASGSWVEVGHVFIDEIGFWMMLLPGSGIYWNVGTTLVALNKTDALSRLGYPAEEIRSLWDRAYLKDGRSFSLQDVEQCSLPPEQWEHAIQRPNFCDFDAGGLDYSVIDEALVGAARETGLDSIQIVRSWDKWLFQIIDVDGPRSVCGADEFKVGVHQQIRCDCDASYGHLNCSAAPQTQKAVSGPCGKLGGGLLARACGLISVEVNKLVHPRIE